MDPASHIFGTALIVTGWFPGERERKGLILPAIAASLAPDLDALTLLKGVGCYADYHQAITHNFWAAPALVLLIVFLFHHWRPAHNFRHLLAVVSLGITLHILADWTTAWGMAFFWPLSSQTHCLRIIFLTDPLFLGALMTGTYLNLRAPFSPGFKKKLSLGILIFFAAYFLGGYFTG